MQAGSKQIKAVSFFVIFISLFCATQMQSASNRFAKNYIEWLPNDSLIRHRCLTKNVRPKTSLNSEVGCNMLRAGLESHARFFGPCNTSINLCGWTIDSSKCEAGICCDEGRRRKQITGAILPNETPQVIRKELAAIDDLLSKLEEKERWRNLWGEVEWEKREAEAKRVRFEKIDASIENAGSFVDESVVFVANILRFVKPD